MHLILCVDENDGLSFGGRRLSRDREVIAHILVLCAGEKLWVNSYTGKMFPENTVCIDEAFLENAKPGDFCFVETNPLEPISDKVESVILYKWNRLYPSTVKFPRAILQNMRLEYTEEFVGNSHQLITMERYIR